MLHYILQTVAFQVFFLIIYDVFLKNETFFNWNRIYLIGTALLSFTLPFLKFDSIKAIVPEPMIIRLPEVIIGEESPTGFDDALIIGSEQISEPIMSFLWTYLWIAGIVLATFILAYKIGKILILLRRNPKRWQGDALIVYLLNSSAAFSFFHYIFLGSNIQAEKIEHIVQHEMVHVKEKHSLDLLVFEIMRIVFWFNPLIYMYQNRLSTLHEFIADAKAVKYKGKSAYYQSLLSQVFETQQISFINPFFKQSLIKKRIVMLSKSKSKQIHLIKYALIIPMAIGMLMYTSSYASAVKDPFPFLQEETMNQELTFQELVENYYNEIVELGKSKHSLDKIIDDYFEPDLMYIQSKDKAAKRQAYMNYLFDEIILKKKKDETLTEAIKQGYEKKRDRFETYEDYLAFKKTDLAKESWENLAKDGELRLVVDNMDQLTEAEQNRKDEKIALIEKDDFYYKLTITDGVKSVTSSFDKKDAQGIIKTVASHDIEVPYAVIDEVPFYQGCEKSGSKEQDRQCTSDKISQFVNKNFNVDLATELGLTGRQRISVIFKIGKDGKVRNVMSRAPHPGLEAEAIRVIKSMPDFTPGKQRGQAVTVPYSLPILFQVQADTPETNQNKNENSESEDIEVPYAVIENVPLYAGCEPSGSNDEDKQCTSNNIAQFVNKNFNVDLATELGLTGRQRISVIFKIGKDGKIRNIQARAPHIGLEAEAKRVIQLLPDFTPGKQRGKAVTVPYSLPILFQVQGGTQETNQDKMDIEVDDSVIEEQIKVKNQKKNDDDEVIEIVEIPRDYQYADLEVPFAVVEEAPSFPSCETMGSNENRKQCTSDKISSFVNINFNTKLAKELGLTGKQRMTVIFKIDKYGTISNIRVRAPHPDLEKEIVRVIEALPKMTPGKQRGKAVVVPYSLPIVFQAQ